MLLATGLLRGAVHPLTRVAEIQALTRDEAAEKRPVHLRAVVALRTNSGVFIHDGGRSIWADADKLPSQVVEGSLVEINGTTDHFGYSPRIDVTGLKVVGTGVVPEARKVSMERLLSGEEDSQRIELEGVVQEVVAAAKYPPLLVVMVEGQLCRVKMTDRGFDPIRVLDARIRVRGMYQPQVNLRSQAVGIELHASAKDMEVITPPPVDAFQPAHVPLAEIMDPSPGGGRWHRKVVAGCVTFIYPGKFLYIREGETSVRVDADGSGLKTGDRVEVAGFVSLEHTLASLGGAKIRVVGRQIPPPVVDATPGHILKPVLSDPWVGSARGDRSGDVVRLRGRLIRILTNAENTMETLLVESEGELFPAYMPLTGQQGGRYAVGSDLELTGACELEFKSDPDSPESITHPISGFHLWLSSPQAVRVLQAPPWWTPKRLSYVLGAVMAVLLVALVWGGLMRREVGRRSHQLALEIATRRETQLEFETTLRERTRLANDLHDSLEQTLTGLSLQLQAADLFRAEEPERSIQHLQLAQQFLDRSREDLHRTVWDLRAIGMEGKGLVEALREKTRAMTMGSPVVVEVTAAGEQQPLPDFIAGNLLLLAQEAVTNALKHAKASTIRVVIACSAEGGALSITDDGTGFDPETAPDQREGHFGLQGMRERVKRLRGTLSIHSEPGHGCRIHAFIPHSAFEDLSSV